MDSIFLQIVIILLLIGINGFLAMSEISVVSARKIRLEQMAEDGRRGARIAISLAAQPGRFLSTTQIGITLIGILAGVFGGATIAASLAAWLSQFPALAPYADPISVTLVVLVITFLSVVLGELAPKQIGLDRAEKIAAAVAPLMESLSRLTSPLVRLLSASSNLVVRILGIHPSDEPDVTVEDIRLLVAEGALAGTIEPAEEEMVKQIFRLGDLRVSSLMKPRFEIIYLDLEDPLELNLEKIINGGYSRYPLVLGGIDKSLGLVRTKDLLAQYIQGRPPDLKAVLQPALYVPESTSVIQVLDQFRQKRIHMAFILDEYGVIQGIITPNDIMEAIVGEIPELDDRIDPDVVLREDGSYLLDGLLPVSELKDLLHVKKLPLEEENSFQTLSGFLMTCLGRIPITGDHYAWNDWIFEIVDMDGMRVDKVLVKSVNAAD